MIPVFCEGGKVKCTFFLSIINICANMGGGVRALVVTTCDDHNAKHVPTIIALDGNSSPSEERVGEMPTYVVRMRLPIPLLQGAMATISARGCILYGAVCQPASSLAAIFMFVRRCICSFRLKTFRTLPHRGGDSMLLANVRVRYLPCKTVLREQRCPSLSLGHSPPRFLRTSTVVRAEKGSTKKISLR